MMASTKSAENLPPKTINLILREVAKMSSKEEGFEGITFIPNEKDFCDIQADIDGPADTPYSQGVFRIRLVVGKDYPEKPPKGYFLTKIFHPNVNQSTGEICLNILKKDWDPKFGLFDVLKYVHNLLIDPFPESGLNEEASKMFLENYEDYSKRAATFVRVHALKKEKKLPDVQEMGVAGSAPLPVKKAKNAFRRL